MGWILCKFWIELNETYNRIQRNMIDLFSPKFYMTWHNIYHRTDGVQIKAGIIMQKIVSRGDMHLMDRNKLNRPNAVNCH